MHHHNRISRTARLGFPILLGLISVSASAEAVRIDPCFEQLPTTRVVWPISPTGVNLDANVIVTDEPQSDCRGFAGSFVLFNETAGRVVSTSMSNIAAAGTTSFVELRPSSLLSGESTFRIQNDFSGQGVTFTTTSSLTGPITGTSTLAPPLIYFHPLQGGQPIRTLEIRTTLSVANPEHAGVVFFYQTNERDDPSTRVLLDLAGTERGIARFAISQPLEFSDELCIAAVPHNQTGQAGPATHACGTALPNANVKLPAEDDPMDPGGGCRAAGAAPLEAVVVLIAIAGLGLLRRRKRV